jgi:hypothetical protein
VEAAIQISVIASDAFAEDDSVLTEEGWILYARYAIRRKSMQKTFLRPITVEEDLLLKTINELVKFMSENGQPAVFDVGPTIKSFLDNPDIHHMFHHAMRAAEHDLHGSIESTFVTGFNFGFVYALLHGKRKLN